MGLYDRKYASQAQEAGALRSESALVAFVKTTYKFFAASLLFATIGALVGFQYFEVVIQPSVRIGIFIAEIVALLGLIFLRSSPGFNVALLFAFTFLSGLALVPLLGFVIAKNGISAVYQALGMTTIVFGAMSLFAIKTKSDLQNWGKILFIALIVVVIGSLINLFLGNPMIQVLIAAACVMLFSLYVAYDTQNIIRGVYDSPVHAAINLYLDFLNIFVSLLQLFGILGSRD